MRKITLKLLGNIVLIRPWAKGDPAFNELAEELTCDRRVKHPIGYYETHTHELFSIDSNDDGSMCAITYGGLLNRIVRVLRRHRYKLRIIDRRTLLPAPDWSKLPPLRKRQPEAIAAIVSAHRGLIVCPTAFGKSFVIKVLCTLYPDFNILVVSRMGRVTASLHKKISEAVDAPVGKIFGQRPKWPDEARVVVTTTRSLYKIPEDWPDILFFDEAHNAAAYDASTPLSRYVKPKMFGFTATPEGRGDKTDLITEAFFGERICDITYQEAHTDGLVAGITALFVKVDRPEIDTDGLSTVSKNRKGYWQNEIRNRVLLKAVETYLKPDESALYYVESIEHALMLRLLIPGTPIAHGGISAERWKRFLNLDLVPVIPMLDEDETDEELIAEVEALRVETEELKHPDLDRLEQQFCNGEIKRVICTGTWKEGVDFPDLAGLVRFDGGAADIGSTQIVGRLSRIGSDGKKTEAIVIDAEDDFGKRYKDRSSKRRTVYRKHGWKIVKLWE